jgi:hypothetical protein
MGWKRVTEEKRVRDRSTNMRTKKLFRRDGERGRKWERNDYGADQ